jgi:tRNA(fMet)-specific endonuclease VapC
MVRKVCLDSDVIIGLLKDNLEVKRKIEETDAIFYTTPINIFEIWYGKEKQAGTKEFAERIIVKEITKEIGKNAADMMNILRKEGEIIDVRDIFIASVCIEDNLELFTSNKKHFQRLKKFGLKLVE